jgi:hypothetical protein
MVKIKNWLIALMLALSSCGDNKITYDPPKVTISSPTTPIHGGVNITVETIIIDSCEYLAGYDNRAAFAFFLTHKGNCKNHKK